MLAPTRIRSTQEPRRSAANTPATAPTRTCKHTPTSASVAVRVMRAAMMSTTGSRSWKLFPRSTWIADRPKGTTLRQLACAGSLRRSRGPTWSSRRQNISYCTRRGRLRPSWSRIRATSAGRACGPADMRAGSPGSTSFRMNAIDTTPHTTTTLHPSLRRSVLTALLFRGPVRIRARCGRAIPG